jgi:hypothetical protein
MALVHKELLKRLVRTRTFDLVEVRHVC